MKTLRAANPGMRDKYFSKAQLAQLDKDQGRERLNAPQQQSLLYLSTGRWLIEEGFHGLEDFLRKIGAWRRIRIALPLVKNALQLCADNMCSTQLISTANNLENLTVTLSASPIATPGGGCLNIPYNAINAICGHALHACDLCAKTREESRACEVRRAFDAVPALKLAARQNNMGAESCPYVGLEVPEDAEG